MRSRTSVDTFHFKQAMFLKNSRLNVDLHYGFQPKKGDRFKVMTFNKATNLHSLQITSPDLGNGLEFKPIVGPKSLILVVTDISSGRTDSHHSSAQSRGIDLKKISSKDSIHGLSAQIDNDPLIGEHSKPFFTGELRDDVLTDADKRDRFAIAPEASLDFITDLTQGGEKIGLSDGFGAGSLRFFENDDTIIHSASTVLGSTNRISTTSPMGDDLMTL